MSVVRGKCINSVELADECVGILIYRQGDGLEQARCVGNNVPGSRIYAYPLSSVFVMRLFSYALAYWRTFNRIFCVYTYVVFTAIRKKGFQAPNLFKKCLKLKRLLHAYMRCK